MELTKKQSQGLDIAVKRYLDKEGITVIGGYAGTGKSTLVKFIISALSSYGVDPETDVCFTSFTGKACQVLQKKGNKNVSTLHKLLFDFKPMPNGKFLKIPKSTISYKVIIVDEVSMAPMSLLEQLASHQNVYVIALGDPFQLPTINPIDDNHLLDRPDIFLDEVMRQAAESEIIRLTMNIREYKDFESEFKNGKEIKIFNQSELNEGMLFWADQVICSTNNTRVTLNNEMRRLLGRGDKPENGDKIICLRNYWETFSDSGSPLVNGTIGTLDRSFSTFTPIPYQYGGGTILGVKGNFISDSNETYSDLFMDTEMILTGERCIDRKLEYRISRSKYKGIIPLEFTYGYVITGHKSQGSEWDKVLVREEGFPFKKVEHARWLYTAATRAAEKLVLVR